LATCTFVFSHIYDKMKSKTNPESISETTILKLNTLVYCGSILGTRKGEGTYEKQ